MNATAPLPALPPLVARLVHDLGHPLVRAGELEALLARPGAWVLFCGGDPVQYPECLDVAVVLPELLAAFPGELGAAVLDRGLEGEVQQRFGLNRWPSLVFLRDGGYLGVIAGMQDWPVYLARIRQLLAAPAGRPPSIGIAVTSGNSAACH